MWKIVKEAIDDARRNAALNQMDNVTFYVGKAEEIVPAEYQRTGIRPDVIVVDPPRKGCDETPAPHYDYHGAVAHRLRELRSRYPGQRLPHPLRGRI